MQILKDEICLTEQEQAIQKTDFKNENKENKFQSTVQSIPTSQQQSNWEFKSTFGKKYIQEQQLINASQFQMKSLENIDLIDNCQYKNLDQKYLMKHEENKNWSDQKYHNKEILNNITSCFQSSKSTAAGADSHIYKQEQNIIKIHDLLINNNVQINRKLPSKYSENNHTSNMHQRETNFQPQRELNTIMFDYDSGNTPEQNKNYNQQSEKILMEELREKEIESEKAHETLMDPYNIQTQLSKHQSKNSIQQINTPNFVNHNFRSIQSSQNQSQSNYEALSYKNKKPPLPSSFQLSQQQFLSFQNFNDLEKTQKDEISQNSVNIDQNINKINSSQIVLTTNSSQDNYFPVRFKQTENNQDLKISSDKFSYESVKQNNTLNSQNQELNQIQRKYSHNGNIQVLDQNLNKIKNNDSQQNFNNQTQQLPKMQNYSSKANLVNNHQKQEIKKPSQHIESSQKIKLKKNTSSQLTQKSSSKLSNYNDQNQLNNKQKSFVKKRITAETIIKNELKKEEIQDIFASKVHTLQQSYNNSLDQNNIKLDSYQIKQNQALNSKISNKDYYNSKNQNSKKDNFDSVNQQQKTQAKSGIDLAKSLKSNSHFLVEKNIHVQAKSKNIQKKQKPYDEMKNKKCKDFEELSQLSQNSGASLTNKQRRHFRQLSKRQKSEQDRSFSLSTSNHSAKHSNYRQKLKRQQFFSNKSTNSHHKSDKNLHRFQKSPKDYIIDNQVNIILMKNQISNKKPKLRQNRKKQQSWSSESKKSNKYKNQLSNFTAEQQKSKVKNYNTPSLQKVLLKKEQKMSNKELQLNDNFNEQVLKQKVENLKRENEILYKNIMERKNSQNSHLSRIKNNQSEKIRNNKIIIKKVKKNHDQQKKVQKLKKCYDQTTQLKLTNQISNQSSKSTFSSNIINKNVNHKFSSSKQNKNFQSLNKKLKSSKEKFEKIKKEVKNKIMDNLKDQQDQILYNQKNNDQIQNENDTKIQFKIQLLEKMNGLMEFIQNI